MKAEYIDWCQKYDIAISDFISRYEILTHFLKFKDITEDRDINYERIILYDYILGTEYQINFRSYLLMKVDYIGRIYSLNPREYPHHTIEKMNPLDQMEKLADYIMKLYKNRMNKPSWR